MQESLQMLKGKEMEEEAEAALQKLSAQAMGKRDETLDERSGIDKVLSNASHVEESADVIVNRTLAPGHRGVWEDDDAGVNEKNARSFVVAAAAPLIPPAEEHTHVLAPPTQPAIHISANAVSGPAGNVYISAPQTVTAPGIKPVTQSSAPYDSDDEDAPDLSVYELQQIGDLARSSSVQREKVALTQLQSQLEGMLTKNLIKKAQDDASIQESAEMLEKLASKEDDRTINNMLKVLSRMNTNLEHKINTTEKVIGGKLRVLDVDEDGSMSVEELKEGVIRTFKQSEISEEDINELIEILDKDRDGKGRYMKA
jgi:Ca2+-binding EF-hand superfamily protein